MRTAHDKWNDFLADEYVSWKLLGDTSKEALAILHKMKISGSPSLKLVDMGCGPCAFEPFWAENVGDVVSVDFSSTMIKKSKDRLKRFRSKNVHLLLADVCHCPLRDRISDVTVCVGVIRHLPEKCGYVALGECSRITKIKGDIYVNDIPNKLHLEAVLHQIGRWLFTFIRPQNVVGLTFFYNPYNLQRKVTAYGIKVLLFQGFNCKVLPIGLFEKVLNKFLPTKLKDIIKLRLTRSPYSLDSEKSDSPSVRLNILQFCTLQFIGKLERTEGN
jgi:ubiquinone/menaquinone biosynthesis C-methylase UbiE